MFAGKKIAIGVPCSWPTVPAKFMISVIGIINEITRLGMDFTFLFSDIVPLDECRNKIIEAFLSGDNGDWLLFLDADMIYPPNMVLSLLTADRDVIGCMYYRKIPPYSPIPALVRDEGSDLIVPYIEEGNGVVEVDVLGGGGLLIRKKTLDVIGTPWFTYTRNQGGLLATEDVHFCRRAKATGFQLYCDTRLVALHINQQFPIGREHWDAHKNEIDEYAYIRMARTLHAIRVHDE